MNTKIANKYLMYFNKNGFITPSYWAYTSELASAGALMMALSSEVGAMKPGQLSREE